MGQVVVADVSGVQDEIEKISFFELYGELLFCRTLLSVADIERLDKAVSSRERRRAMDTAERRDTS